MPPTQGRVTITEPASATAWPELDDPADARPLRWRLATAIVAALLIHLTLGLLVPAGFMPTFDKREAQPSKTYQVRLQAAEKPVMPEYVEANPDVPENRPDETNQVSDRDQQASQEDPDPRNDSEVPEVDGESPDSQKIVQGRLDQPTPSPPAPPPSEAAEASRPRPQQARDQPSEAAESSENPQETNPPAETEAQTRPDDPLPPTPPPPDFVKQEPQDEEGPASTPGPVGEATEKPEDPVEREPTPPLPSAQMTEQQEEPARQTSSPQPVREPSKNQPPQPRPRPRLQPEVVSGPLRQSTGVASQAGAIAIDARFSEYGDYSARMVAAVSRWWNEQVQRTGLGPRARDTTVRLRFKLDRYGDVSELEVIGSSSTRLGTVLCKDAVMGRAPYGEWTQDMVNTLGEEMTLTFTFHYR